MDYFCVYGAAETYLLTIAVSREMGEACTVNGFCVDGYELRQRISFSADLSNVSSLQLRRLKQITFKQTAYKYVHSLSNDFVIRFFNR